MSGFDPEALCLQSIRDNQLHYTPNNINNKPL